MSKATTTTSSFRGIISRGRSYPVITISFSQRKCSSIIEDEVFREELPIHLVMATDDKVDTVNVPISDPINDTVKQRLGLIIKLLLKEPGLKSGQVAKQLSVSEITVRRDMQVLEAIISFNGAPKTGGYFLSESFKNKLSK